MSELWWDLSVWFGLALLSSIVSLRLGISAVLAELIVGMIAGNLFHLSISDWVNLLANFGAVVITFLAGAELESSAIKSFWKDSFAIGFMGFFPPFLGTGLLAYFFLGWNVKQSVLAGTILSSISIAIVYAVLMEANLNEKPLGKLLLAASFINGLGTLLVLTLLFVKIDRTFWIFLFVTLILLVTLPSFTKRYFGYVNNHPSEPEVKYVLLVLVFLGFLASQAGSVAVFPAYLVGVSLANLFAENRELAKRMRMSAIALLTPFYFLKAGSLVDIKMVLTSLGLVFLFFFVRFSLKLMGLYPVGVFLRLPGRLNLFLTMMMSTGLTFDTVAALYGLDHGLINKWQYSLLESVVLLSAVIPTLMAQRFFFPRFEDASLKRKEEVKRNV
ncbi:MAG: cation:proton antiporter [Aquificaceae bacterium]